MRTARNKARRVPVYRPTPKGPQRPPMGAMTPEELRDWFQRTRTQLEQKMRRERAYLDRRAARGTYTPTNEAYEADQLLEADLLAFLQEMEQGLKYE